MFFKRCKEEYFPGGDLSKYPCFKGDGNCVIHYEVPIRCKLCRFKKCLDLGMDPSRILDDEAKKKFCRVQYRNGTNKKESLVAFERKAYVSRLVV